jgi:septal ring factor EnvC (AmiA/AmiB activator)
VAPGRIAYADWLRGFGNLLIIDHGDGFMSLYGYNESLLKQAGETVASGEAVARVGSSGGSDGTGLYFELRRAGTPVDPLAWVGR